MDWKCQIQRRNTIGRDSVSQCLLWMPALLAHGAGRAPVESKRGEAYGLPFENAVGRGEKMVYVFVRGSVGETVRFRGRDFGAAPMHVPPGIFLPYGHRGDARDREGPEFPRLGVLSDAVPLARIVDQPQRQNGAQTSRSIGVGVVDVERLVFQKGSAEGQHDSILDTLEIGQFVEDFIRYGDVADGSSLPDEIGELLGEDGDICVFLENCGKEGKSQESLFVGRLETVPSFGVFITPPGGFPHDGSPQSVAHVLYVTLYLPCADLEARGHVRHRNAPTLADGQVDVEDPFRLAHRKPSSYHTMIWYLGAGDL